MTEGRNRFEFLDLLVLLVRWKRFLVISLILTVISTYLVIYIFIDEQYDSSALIIPAEENNIGGLASLFGDFKGLPLGLNSSTNPEMSMYNTIIYSRTNIDKIISKFNLYEIYDIDTTFIDYEEATRKKVMESIKTEETEFGAYRIKVRTISPTLSANITNFIIENLNEKIIYLKIKKAKNNRQFLENRMEEIKLNLKKSEDSLKLFQENEGLLTVDDQLKAIITVFTDLESDLIKKQIEFSVMKNILDKDSPQLNTLEMQVMEYKKKLDKLKSEGQPGSTILSINSLPDKSLNYLRLYRNVEINTTLLKFVMPLYEQSKLEEQKDVPVLQVIDFGIPAKKKSFPPRTILTLIISFGVFIVLIIFVLLKERDITAENEKLNFILKNIFKFNVTDENE